jgi:Icc-related predicted phosphoesterase
MLIAFMGDVHGRIFHGVAALAALQARMGVKFDLLIQVGDLGFPDPSRGDPATRRYLAVDPAEADLGRFLQPTASRAKALRHVRESFARPVYFVRGNHEDFEWLAGLPVDPTTNTAPADGLDLLHYVPDGTVLDTGGVRIAFLGGVEEQSGAAGINMAAYESLVSRGRRSVDVLVTHEGPYGSSTGHHGDTHGSKLMSELLDAIEPTYHVFGHAHVLTGPTRVGHTTYLGLDGLVASPLWHPEAVGLQPGCLAILDTATGELTPVVDSWLADFPTPFDFEAWAGR